MGTQQELFSTNHYVEEFLGKLEKRLPPSDEVTVADVSSACNVSASKVYEWMQAGEILWIDHGTPRKPFYHIYRNSVIGRYRRQLAASGFNNTTRSES